MKSKHIGLLGLALAGLAVLIVAGQLLWLSWSSDRLLGLGGYPSYSLERLTIDTAAVSRMDLVEPTLPKLVQPESIASEDLIGTGSEVDYAMFGRRPPEVRAVRPIGRPARPKPHPYRVSMTYISGEHRYAVIDKKFYRQNARLPNGENLAEISVGAVRIDSAAGPHWVEIGSGGEVEIGSGGE